MIKSLADLLRAADHVRETTDTKSDILHIITNVVGSVIWPILILIIVLMFRSDISGLLRKVKKVDTPIGSFEAEQEIEKKIESSAAEALFSPNLDKAVSISKDEVRRSVEVDVLSRTIQPEVIRKKIDQISAEYEGIRANMPSGNERTRSMSAVMGKMRTLGRAVFPYRHDLVASPSPGHRLFAIAALQMVPDYNLLDWLASATTTEAPFVQFQALNALMIAVRNAGPEMKAPLVRALKKAKSGLSESDPDQSRWRLSCSIEQELNFIPDIKGN